VFSFRIRALPAGAIAEIAGADQRPAPGARILVADDNASIRDLVRAVLESCGAEVTEAADGAAAIEAATSWPFDLILLDLRMPRISGKDVAAALREGRGPNANIPIVAFTASKEAFEDGFCQLFGFDAVLTKPVVVRELLSVVARYTGASAQENAA
jgi:CheY-like chemotaxis protein